MNIIYQQRFRSMPIPETSFAGKTVIVTGSNTGLGKEAARHYAHLDASTLIIGVRNVEKGEAAKADIIATTKRPVDSIQVWHVDMASYASVQLFAKRVDAELERVDIFLANAGVARSHYELVEGDERSLAVNCISTLLLTALVLPKMRDTAAKFGTRPVLTLVNSSAHGMTKFSQKDAPEGQILATVSATNNPGKDPYAISKLLQLLAVRAIAEEHPASACPVTINTVCPGLCHSELSRDANSRILDLVMYLLARSAEEGSRTLIHATIQGPDTHGKFLSNCEIGNPSPFVLSPEGSKAQVRVWEELVAKLETIQPGVTKNF